MTIEKPDYPSLIDQLAKEAHQGCGLSYELYGQRFQSSVDALLERLPNDKRDSVIALAKKHDYIHEQPNHAPVSTLDWDDDTQYCSHGIDIDCCPAGCGG
ncbi:hypothetical protein AB4455_01105 [Vibrio sp. 10N.261.46.E12]|uniref:hypothetical protein n=1 Tax=unclassified Vibrio TaxID=2614977 RepID=UPI000C83EAC0|nr:MULTISPECIES: hypothetical protein [unclassified Vibrio]PML89274.1 hypothetical protein BCT66_07975 [Vibrio sp. 10N.261.49.E11]PMN80274.1 hypothetical protein BCT25_01790 [Vibrio sp. 10N.261.45.A6]PMN82208.1 hypothetical protein BCT22_13970 [Vibrio sp. 10N.261.45.A1]